MSLAAIVPVYNRPTSVRQALDTIAAQGQPPTRLIVVDDGSTDETADRVQQWFDDQALPYRTRLIRQPNQGAAAARNRGAAEADGCDYLAYLDSDDLWPADYLKRMTAALDARPDAVAASCDWKRHDLATDETATRSMRHIADQTTRRLLLDEHPKVAGTVLRRAAFERVGGFDSPYIPAEVHQFMLRLSLLGPWLHVPGRPVVYRLNMGKTTGEEGHLTHRHADARLRRVRMIDRFVLQEGGRDAIDQTVWRRGLGRLWFRAGLDLQNLNRRGEAAQCFRHAVALRPWRLRWRLRALTCALGGGTRLESSP